VIPCRPPFVFPLNLNSPSTANGDRRKAGYEAGLKEYVDRERAAVDLINSVGQLMYGKGVELVFFRNHLLDISISEVIKLFTYAEEVVKKPIDVNTTAEVARGLLALDLAPSKIDIGKLSHEFTSSRSKSVGDFLKTHLSGFIGQDKHRSSPRMWSSTASGGSGASPLANW
jgi:glyceraldehyde 3-phosphate dehydrogenase